MKNRKLNLLAAAVTLSGLMTISEAKAQQQLPNLGQQASSFASSIQSDIESILGEAEQDIMDGIKDIIMSYINTAISQLLGASPLASVEKLKNLLKDAHSKLQKVQYQDYKVDYEEKKVNTELTQNFCDYYNSIDLKGELTELGRAKSRLNAFANNSLFTDTERKSLALALAQVSSTDDIVGDVRTACNQGSGDSEAIWMSTAERTQILDAAKQEIQLRRQMIKTLTAQLANVYAYRVKEKTQQTAAGSWFDQNSTINRRVGISEKLF